MESGGTVDQLEIKIEASSSEAVAKLNSLTSALKELRAETNKSFGGVSNKIKGIVSGISGSSDSAAVKNIRKQREALNRASEPARQLSSFDTETPKASVQTKGSIIQTGVLESTSSLEEKRSVLERISGTLRECLGTSEKLKNVLSKDTSLQNLVPEGLSKIANESKNAIGGLTDKLAGFASSHPAAAAAFVALKSTAQTAWRVFKDFSKLSFSALKRGLELAASGARKLASALLGLARSGVQKAVSGIKTLAKAVGSRLTAPFKKSIEQIVKWKQMLASALFYSTVFRAMSLLSEGVKTGMDNLYQYSRMVGTDFAPAMDKLATSALYLKNSIGAMAAPIIEAVAPAVDFLVDKFVELLNVIGKTFAALTGKDVYSQARKHAVEYAESAEEAEKKTAEFRKFLLGIDELNIMPSQDEGTGEVKNPLEDYASMFEEVQVPVEQLDWAKQIREAIENGDWHSVGRIIAEKLNEIIDGWDAYGWGRKLGELLTNGLNVAFGFLENFDFVKFGQRIADAFNGLFDGIDWDLLGRTLAEKWNSLFDFIYGFARGLNWTGLGSDIANAINGFIDQLDPHKAAAAVNEFILGIFRTLNTAITNINWAELGTKLAQFINDIDWAGIVYNGLMVIVNGLAAAKEFIDAFLDEWEWEEMADEIASGINTALSKLDPRGLGETLGRLFRTAFDFLREFVANIQWNEIGKDISQFIQGINLKETADAFLGMVKEVVNGVVIAVKAFLDETPDDVLANLTQIIGAIALGAVALMSKNKVLLITEGLALLIGIFAEFGEEIKALAEKLAENFNEMFASINWVEVGEYVSEGLINLLDTIITLIDGVDWGQIAVAIVDFLGGIDWPGLAISLVDGIMSLLGAAAESVVSLIPELPSLLLVGLKIIGAILLGIIDAVADLPGWVWDHVITPFVDSCKSLPDSFFAIGESVINSMLEGLEKAFQGIKDFLNDAVDFVSNIWNTITGKTSNSSTNGLKVKNVSEISYAVGNIEAPKAYASGGFPSQGDMFIANEAGPELVGKIGQKTTVANNEQITSGIAEGVRDANMDVVNAVYAMANMIVKAVEEKDTDINLDGQSLARGIQPYQNRLSTLKGTSLIN